MKCFTMLVAIVAIAASAAPGKSLAQAPGTTPPPVTNPPPAANPPPVTGIKPDRTIADPATRKAIREKDAALRQKRADCRKQARAQKVSLLKRNAFVRACMRS
ncbi:MAG: hypothetical protein C5B56_02345 [Proteobacteria bacterium]|nr:MAG: hypothetical protein C5B56_02345 [Pseudomonadota bacterium]